MDKPKVAQYKPYRIAVDEGERYLWCSCGLSKAQPFCDKSHIGTDFKPVPYTANASRAVLFCGCKHSATGPVCDGSHNNLADEYAEDERSLVELLADTAEAVFDVSGRAILDGGCYVQRPQGLDWQPVGGIESATVICAADDAKFLNQYVLRLGESDSEVLQYPGADLVLFFTGGQGRVSVAGKMFDVSPRTGIHVRSGEAFHALASPRA